MTDDSTDDPTILPPPSPAADGTTDDALPRREFLRVAGAGAGLLMVGGLDFAGRRRVPGFAPRTTVPPATASSDVVVIGAGGWGSFTALNVRKRGARVTVVDAYGPVDPR